MSFLRADLLRAVPGAMSLGGHLFEVDRPGPCGCCAGWQLRCGSCLALLSHGQLRADAPLLAGAQAVRAVGGLPAVTWAWGVLPHDRHAGRPVEVVFDRGIRLPVVAEARLLDARSTARLWLAAGAGRARHVLALHGGTTAERQVDRHARTPSPARCHTSARGRTRSPWSADRPS